MSNKKLSGDELGKMFHWLEFDDDAKTNYR
jgi:hypothetical protein